MCSLLSVTGKILDGQLNLFGAILEEKAAHETIPLFSLKFDVTSSVSILGSPNLIICLCYIATLILRVLGTFFLLTGNSLHA